jgi:polyisoprenoid-binding protein YceI
MVALVIAYALSLVATDQPVPTTYRIVPGLSQASYSVDEVFIEEGNRFFTAVGATTSVTGEVVLDRARPSQSRISEIVIDVNALASDSHRRDRAIRERFLESRRFPHARLTNATLRDIPTEIADGRPFRYTVVGSLTVHGQTRESSWRGEATVVGDTLRGTARTQVKMSAFGIEVPSFLWLRVADDVRLEIRFVAVTARRTPGGDLQ